MFDSREFTLAVIFVMALVIMAHVTGIFGFNLIDVVLLVLGG